MMWSHNTISFPSKGDLLFFRILGILTGIAGVIVLFIFAFLLFESVPALRNIGLIAFFSDPSWHPTQEYYNLLPMLIGTLLSTIGAVTLATPTGILLALFCHYYAPTTIAMLYRTFIELLAGIPSVVYGLWGLVVLVPLIAKLHPPGPSLFAGIIILMIMILPTVTLVTHSALHQVPAAPIQAATALGLKRWSIISHVIFPLAWPGILTGVILQTGRALGETMAVLMVCGNVVQIPSSLFDPVRTLTANIALEMAYATDTHRASLFFTGLLLLTVVIGLAMTAQRLRPHHA